MSNTFALIIGIDDYSELDTALGLPRGTNDLRGARNDVHAIAMLVRMMEVPSANIRVLSNPLLGPNDFAAVALGREPLQAMDMVDAGFGYATQQAILDGLAWLSVQVSAHPGAQGIIYYSGHSVLTPAGHPCLCPTDTTGNTAPSSVNTADPGVVGWYITMTAGLSALAEIIGTTDPERVARFIGHISAEPGGFHDARGYLPHCAAEAGEVCDDAALDRFLSLISNLGPGIETEENPDVVVRWLDGLTRHPLSPAAVDDLLSGDPIADGGQYANMISFNKAFYAALRGIPEDRNVHIVLETCMEGQRNAYYDGAGIPLSHGGMVMMSSCRVGEASERAVFDNRWYGAFTWALVTLLSQTPVFIADEGRSFTTTYETLDAHLQDLLKMLGFTQRSGVWAQPAQREWRVFGTTVGAWQEQAQLAPVRVREEIDPGATGHIYQIRTHAPGAQGDPLGWLVVTTQSITVNGVVWEAAKEYWIWNGAPFPASSFKLVRPLGSPNGSGLSDWLSALNIQQPAGQTHKYTSKVFQGSGSQSENISGFYEVVKVTPTGSTGLCALKASGPSLSWRLAGSAPTNASRILFSAPAGVVPPSGDEVRFLYKPSPILVSFVGNVLTESPV